MEVPERAGAHRSSRPSRNDPPRHPSVHHRDRDPAAVARNHEASVIARKNLNNYAVTHGTTKTPLASASISTAKPWTPDRNWRPRSSVRWRRAARPPSSRSNATTRPPGRTAVSSAGSPASPKSSNLRLKRYQALLNVTGDKRFTDDPSKDTADALSEKRKEPDDLARTLAAI